MVTVIQQHDRLGEKVRKGGIVGKQKREATSRRRDSRLSPIEQSANLLCSKLEHVANARDATSCSVLHVEILSFELSAASASPDACQPISRLSGRWPVSLLGQSWVGHPTSSG